MRFTTSTIALFSTALSCACSGADPTGEDASYGSDPAGGTDSVGSGGAETAGSTGGFATGGDDTSGNGGFVASGGVASGGVASGGVAAASGGAASGGAAGVGGGFATGGAPSTGGGAASGGAFGTGGDDATGGAAAGGSDMGVGGFPGGDEDATMGGFAAVEKYGIPTTTGGSAGSTVDVSSFAELKAYAESPDVLVIRVSGTIAAPGEHGLIKVQSNKTILGVGGSARLDKVTLSVDSWNRPGETCEAGDEGSFTPASNVIIRNIEFTGLENFPDDSDVDPDAIRVECFSHHVWIDHNTFQYGADGSTDVKRGADMVTLSYNHYVQTDKTALIGHSDNNGAQDEGRLHVTFHHNFFDGTDTRTPRVRFGYAHVYNNYFDVTSHVFRIGPGGEIYAEANYVASTEGKILRDTENEGALTWTNSNVWDESAYGGIGSELLDADQSVAPPPYSDPIDAASASPPPAGVGLL